MNGTTSAATAASSVAPTVCVRAIPARSRSDEGHLVLAEQLVLASMTEIVREETRVPSAEELERLFDGNGDDLCHTLDTQRPGYRLCGLPTKTPIKGAHSSGSIEEQLRTGRCECGKKKCPDCLRINALRRTRGLS